MWIVVNIQHEVFAAVVLSTLFVAAIYALHHELAEQSLRFCWLCRVTLRQAIGATASAKWHTVTVASASTT